MVSRLVKVLGSYTLVRDERGIYSLLDANAREVASGPDMEAMESAARLLQGILAVQEAA